MPSAIRTLSFIDTLGINTHIDFAAHGYQNLTTVAGAIKYLGVTNIRDSAQTASDANAWLQVSHATGAKFDDFIAQTSPAGMATDLGFPVMTTEIGWDENQGFTQTQIADYVLDAALDGIKYGDVKTYFYALFNDGSGDFGLMNSDGTPKPAGIALHDLTTLLADTGANAASFTPGLLNYTLSTSDNTVLMEKSDGTFWLAVWNEGATAHSVTVMLGSNATQFMLFDPLTGTSAVQTESDTGSFTFTLSDHPLLVEMAGAASGRSGSGGSVGVMPDPVVTVPPSETVAAGGTVVVAGVSISDPWAATATGSLTLNVTTTAGTVAMNDASGNLVAGSGTSGIHISGTLSELNADLSTLSYTAGSADASVTVDVWDQAGVEATKLFEVTVTGSSSSGSGGGSSGSSGSALPNPVVTAPASETVAAGATAAFPGVSVSDPWAAANPGTLALNVTATIGTVSMNDAGGNLVAGSGTSGIHISGTLSELNADLSTLSYTAGSADASVTVDVWDQAGVEATKNISVTVIDPITIPASQSSVTENVSNATIVAAAGYPMIFIGGIGDVVTATGGNETIQAFQGNNTITTGGGNDKISFGGSNNVINAGAGNNVLRDSNNNNTIVLPAGGKGYDDIFGPVLTNGDTFDLRPVLAATNWNGDPASIVNFVKLTASGSSELIKVDPTGVKGGSLYTVAKLEDSGSASLDSVLAHSIT